MSPVWTFLVGLIILGGFCWYFITEIPLRKRLIGSALTILLVAFCIDSCLPPDQKIQLGLDLRGGSSFLIRLVKDGEAEITPSMQDQAVEVIRKRVDKFGVSEPVITPQGSDRILVQIPGLDGERIVQAREQLQKVAKLEFKLVHPQSDSLVRQIESGEAFIEPEWELKTYKDQIRGKEVEMKLLVRKKADLSGDTVSRAGAFFDNRGYGVMLGFNSEGAKKFADLTTAHVQDRFAIVLDGEVQSAPVIQEPITGGQATITGRFTEQEARNLSSVLENPLATPVLLEEERSVSSTLGSDSIKSGVFAGLIGLALTFLFVLVYYQFSGIIAIIGLLVNIVLLFGVMAMFNFVLTLPGIAGIVLTIGMAVDANVLIYERLREEMAAGKSIRGAIQAGYDKAFSAIFDANITTLITSAILFWKASGSVRGFAVTLTVGIIASMFAALLVTRNLFSWVMETDFLTRLTMLNMSPKRVFDFLGKRRLAFTVSLILVLGTIGVVWFRGEKNLGIDFKGGDLIVLRSANPVNETDMRKIIAPLGFGDVVIQRQTILDKESFAIRAPFESGQTIMNTLVEKMPEAGFDLEGIEKVGPTVGREMTTGSLVAIGLSLLGILIYVTIRFEFAFAVGALVALVHDIIITIGLMSLFGREMSMILVGAILTIAGYSINDTIVVFDRIREGIALGQKGSLLTIMNRSINETLSRTIITSGATLISVLALYIWGGPVLNDFALALLLGIVVGTYSSIFVASPVAFWWSTATRKNLHQEIRKTEEAKAAAVKA